MGFTREEKKAWIANYEANRSARKKAKSEKMVNEYQLKKSHDWAGQWVKHDKVGSARSFEKTHCKKCGIHILNFKMNPTVCPGFVEDVSEDTDKNEK